MEVRVELWKSGPALRWVGHTAGSGPGSDERPLGRSGGFRRGASEEWLGLAKWMHGQHRNRLKVPALL
jgi:hypothetical protein